jgi:hypothetical protein
MQPKRAIRWYSRAFGSEEQRANVPPRVYTAKTLHAEIMGRGKENAFSPEVLEMTRCIVDEVVRCEDAFITTKNDVTGGNEREMAIQPREFCRKGSGDLHGRTGDENLEILLQIVYDGLAFGKDIEVSEKLAAMDHGFGGGVMLLGNRAAQAETLQLVATNGGSEGFVIEGNVFSQSVGNGFIHINANTFQV